MNSILLVAILAIGVYYWQQKRSLPVNEDWHLWDTEQYCTAAKTRLFEMTTKIADTCFQRSQLYPKVWLRLAVPDGSDHLWYDAEINVDTKEIIIREGYA